MKIKFSNETYDVLKWIAQILLPASATFIGAVGTYLKWPPTEAVTFILIAFDTFLGTILGISSLSYNNSGQNNDTNG